MPDKKFEKLVAVEALNLFTGANEEFAKRAKEYVFYDDVPSSEEEVIRRAKDADGILVNANYGKHHRALPKAALHRDVL